MTRHTVHTHGAACRWCHTHRPHTVLLCDTCDWIPADAAPTWAEIEETTR